jgi:ribonuclease HI
MVLVAVLKIYAPTDALIGLHGVFLGHATNNIAKYNAFIELLADAISFGICHLIVSLNSQLVLLQLSNIFSI